MTPDEVEILKAGAEAAVKPFSNLLERLAGPAVDELGLTLRDSIRVFRFRRQVRLFQRLQETLDEAGVVPEPVPIKILAPAVAYAALEDDDDLQDRWAALLSNAANPERRDTIAPYFVDMLRSLSSSDARLLDRICQEAWWIMRYMDYPASGTPSKVKVGTAHVLFSYYCEVNELPGGSLPHAPSDDVGDYLELDEVPLQFSISMNNLIRLGLLVESDGPTDPPVQAQPHPLAQRGVHYFVTALGFAFVRACRSEPFEIP